MFNSSQDADNQQTEPSEQISLSLSNVTEIAGGKKDGHYIAARRDFPDGRWDILKIKFRTAAKPVHTRLARGLDGESAVAKMKILLAGGEIDARLPVEKRKIITIERRSITLSHAETLLDAGQSFPPLAKRAMGTRNYKKSMGRLVFVEKAIEKARRRKSWRRKIINVIAATK